MWKRSYTLASSPGSPEIMPGCRLQGVWSPGTGHFHFTTQLAAQPYGPMNPWAFLSVFLGLSSKLGVHCLQQHPALLGHLRPSQGPL